MPLTPAEIHVVQDTWKSLAGDATTNGVMMFKRIFEETPDMRNLYKFAAGKTDFSNCPELNKHATRVYKKIAVSVDQLDNRRILAADLKTLGSRHPGYGVVPDQHVAPTFNGLMYMVDKQSPSGAGAERRAAFKKAFNLICNSMGLYTS